MSVIAVCSGKGSPGATFVAVNLTAALARGREKALLLDLDPAGGDVAAYLGLDTRRGLYPLLRMHEGIPGLDALLREAERHAGIRAVCGFPEASACPAGPGLLAEMLRRAGESRSVLADLGRITPESAAVASEADLVLLVVRPDLVSVLGAERALRCLESGGVARGKIAVVVSGSERRRPADVAEVAQAIGIEVIGSIPFHRRSARKALTSQSPISNGPLARSFVSLASAARRRLPESASETTERRDTAETVQLQGALDPPLTHQPTEVHRHRGVAEPLLPGEVVLA